ncbi:MAG: hypothetical protein HXY22_11455 [Alphaproteobacteria bacterium]|nr:hypothetical protein [Alphaproteobacteria bacterium]
MFRAISSLMLMFVIAPLGAIYYVYGEIEPCRVLAKEYTYRDLREGSVLDMIGVDIEKLHRIETSQYSSSECAGKLVDAWVERLGGNGE